MDSRPEVAVMYSGGLDSYIAVHYARAMGFDPIPVYVNMGHPYAHKEVATILNIEETNAYFPNTEIINMYELYPLIRRRMSNQIIPSRNVMLATIGSMIAPRVWVCAVDGEQLGKEHDKSERFYKDTTDLLTFTNKFFVDKTIVETPFAYMSKTEAVRWALDNHVRFMDMTVSCYYDIEGHCGNCLTCYKRYVAFKLNGIDTREHFRNNPLWSAYAHEMIQQIPVAEWKEDYSRFTPKRIAEHNRLMDLVNAEMEANKTEVN